MKLATFIADGRQRYGIVTERGIVDLTKRLGEELPDLKALIARGGDGLAELADAAPDYSVDGVTLLPPIANPGMIICMGLNTYSHLAEYRERAGKDAPAPTKPWVFLRMPRSITGHGQKLLKPNVSPLYDYEGEIALIIGKYGRHVPEDKALDHIFGYSCFNEGSVRDFQVHCQLYTAGKNFPRSGSFGPWIVTADEIESPTALTVTTRVNGNVVQSMPYDDLIFGFEKMISYISSFTELHPGDVIVTGTGAGVGAMRNPKLWLKDGDVCEVEVSQIGTLRNFVTEAEGSDRGPVTRTDAEAVYAEAIAEMGR